MSTIERAMRKLNGEAEPLEEDEIVEEIASSTTVDEVDAAQRAASEREGPQVAEQAQTNAPISEISSEPVESRDPAADVAGDHGLLDSPVAPERMVELDLERLKTLGYLVPGDSPMQLSEEYQTIKRRLIANTVEGVLDSAAPKNLIMITSSLPSEGKTYTSMNLALSIAMEVERRVLLVDVDIIKSDLSRLFGVANRTGLFDVLAHPELGIEDVMLNTNVPSLSLVSAGTIRHKITENLASSTMRALTIELASRYPDRLVIFDCPPILATSSAAALAPLVGQVVLVVESCQTTRQTLNHALSMMGDAEVTGVILNKVRHRGVSSSGYYGYGYGGYGYGYGYGHEQSNNR